MLDRNWKEKKVKGKFLRKDGRQNGRCYLKEIRAIENFWINENLTWLNMAETNERFIGLNTLIFSLWPFWILYKSRLPSGQYSMGGIDISHIQKMAYKSPAWRGSHILCLATATLDTMYWWHRATRQKELQVRSLQDHLQIRNISFDQWWLN